MAHFYDWLSCRFPCSESLDINGGRVVYIDRHGGLEYKLDRHLKLVDSHSTAVQVRTHGETLEVSGNPTKFLLGHNLYGLPDLRMTALLFGWRVWELLELEPAFGDFLRWTMGDIAISRVDVTRMYRPDDAPAGWVRTWLSVASSKAHGGHQRVTNRGVDEGNTLYVGQHSRRISLKLYDKAAEFRRHPPTWPADISKEEGEAWIQGLTEYAHDTLRVEVTLRSMELKARGLDTVGAWTPAIGDALVDERVGKLSVLEDLRMAEDEVKDLPRRLQGPYALWRQGADLREVYSRAQFYRYRAALLPYGVDIAHVQPHAVVPERAHALGRPLSSFLEGPGLSPPADEHLELLSLFEA